MNTIIIFGIILFVIPLLLLIWSWKALLAYVLIIGCPLIWYWITFVTTHPDLSDGRESYNIGIKIAEIAAFFTFLFLFGIALSILLVGLYRIIKSRHR